MCQDSPVDSVGQDAHGYSLDTRGNVDVKSLAGLSGLPGALDGSIHVRNFGSWQSLAGLERVHPVGKDAHGYSLYIRSNAALKSLAERGGLQGAFGGRTLVQNCGSLRSLAGLERITSVGKSANGYSLYISGNAALKSLAGLGCLQGALDGSILVQNCLKRAEAAALRGRGKRP